MDKIRLNKFLAECGVCSRREADRLIDEKRVTVNGKTAEAGVRVTAEDVVCLNGKSLRQRPAKVVLAYYKPVGIVCTEKDRFAEKTIREALNYPMRVTYAGRLDKDSEGLILMSNDGDLIQHMMKGANRHEKEYVVKVKKEITTEFLKRMGEGVFLRELEIKTRPCELFQDGKYTFRIVLTQGVNRQIRRMCKELGYEVASLRRIRVLNIRLDQLRPGEYREITGEELDELYQTAGMKREIDGQEKGYEKKRTDQRAGRTAE